MQSIDRCHGGSNTWTFNINVALLGFAVDEYVHNTSIVVAFIYDVIHHFVFPVCTDSSTKDSYRQKFYTAKLTQECVTLFKHHKDL